MTSAQFASQKTSAQKTGAVTFGSSPDTEHQNLHYFPQKQDQTKHEINKPTSEMVSPRLRGLPRKPLSPFRRGNHTSQDRNSGDYQQQRSNSNDLVDDYWQRVKQKFGAIANRDRQKSSQNELMNLHNSSSSISGTISGIGERNRTRQRSLSPYNPEGKGARSNQITSPTEKTNSNAVPSLIQKSNKESSPLGRTLNQRATNEPSRRSLSRGDKTSMPSYRFSEMTREAQLSHALQQSGT